MGTIPSKSERSKKDNDGDEATSFYDTVLKGDYKCDVCGQIEANAYWHCKNTFRVCARCALEVLPALIADAIGTRTSNCFREVEDRIVKAFRGAMIINLTRSLNKEKKRQLSR